MAGTVFTEWLNSNSTRNYPIVENLDRKDKTGSVILPNDFLVAAQVNISRDEAEGSFFVKEIGSFSSSCYVTIGYSHTVSGSTVIEEISKITIDYSVHTPYQYYPFVGEQENSHIVGSLCIGSIASLQKEISGRVDFLPDATLFEPNCIFVSIPALKAVSVYSGGSLIYIADDVLRLKAGENIRLTYEDDTKAIRIDAINGLNLRTADDCENNPFSIPGCIKKINGIGPDENGNFVVRGSECITVQDDAGSHSISLIDLCSQSCCGCSQLEVLTSSLEQLSLQELSLRTMIETAQSQQSSLISSLASTIV